MKSLPATTTVLFVLLLAAPGQAIEKHPANVHYNTAGQLKAGKPFAEAFLTQD